MKRLLIAALVGACLLLGGPAQGADAAPKKVLRLAFSSAETSLDPAKINDLYSRTITPHIFEGLIEYDHLARPARLKPQLAEAMPEVSADFRVWTFKIRRGIYFADDPAFQGRKRELVAQDFVYSFKRIFDPANKSPIIGNMLTVGFVGLNALREEALAKKTPFDYERAVEGLQAPERYTLRIVLDEPRPRLLETLAQPDLLGAVAREVVAFYGDKIDAHPVGTGPFRLKQWRRGSLIVLERSPYFREAHYDAEPAPDDAEGQAILARMKGRRLPIVDEVQVSIILENQPRWLTFLNGGIDALATVSNPVPTENVNQAMPGGKLAPNLAKRGIVGQRVLNSDIGLTMFNMEHPVVGGYTAEKVALRRAISLGYDVQREIQVYWKGSAIPAQSPIAPHTTGYDPAFKSEASDYDPARAKALLDLYGYVDRDGDGWREQPDGSPLLLEFTTQPEQRFRTFDELWKKALDALGIRVKFMVGQWPENLKSARAGKLMMWQLNFSSAGLDGQAALARYFGPEAGSQNMPRFQLDAFDQLYLRMQQLPDGPERAALFTEAKRIAAVYVPWKNRIHRLESDLLHPWLIGYRRPLFWQNWWHLVDIDTTRRPGG